MDGAPYLRKIDLNVYKGYSDLLKTLENMFKFTIGKFSLNPSSIFFGCGSFVIFKTLMLQNHEMLMLGSCDLVFQGNIQREKATKRQSSHPLMRTRMVTGCSWEMFHGRCS